MIWALLIILFAVFGILGFFKGGLRDVNFVGITGVGVHATLAPALAMARR